MAVHPDLLDRPSDDAHEFVLVDEAGERCDDQSEDDPRYHDPEVFEVLEERLFLFRVRLIPEFEHFVEEEHAPRFEYAGFGRGQWKISLNGHAFLGLPSGQALIGC